MSKSPPLPPDDPADQRREGRSALEVEVSMESDHNFYAGITGNVSTGGVFVATYTPPPAGSEVSLDLKLAGTNETYRLRGVVCWSRAADSATDFAPAGVGIRWIDLPPPVAQAIQRFVDKRDTILFDDD